MTRTLRRVLFLAVVNAAGALFCSPILRAQSKNPADLGAGKLLVSQRDSSDPNFSESVILLIDAGKDGAAGLMINRPTKLPVSRALSDVKGADGHAEPVYVGGPVTMEAVMGLLEARKNPRPKQRVVGDVYLISTKSELESALGSGAGAGELRVFFGYCGWGPGQLESELRRGEWYIFDGSEQLVFDATPSTLWSRLIARAEVRTARLHPPGPRGIVTGMPSTQPALPLAHPSTQPFTRPFTRAFAGLSH